MPLFLGYIELLKAPHWPLYIFLLPLKLLFFLSLSSSHICFLLVLPTTGLLHMLFPLFRILFYSLVDLLTPIHPLDLGLNFASSGNPSSINLK